MRLAPARYALPSDHEILFRPRRGHSAKGLACCHRSRPQRASDQERSRAIKPRGRDRYDSRLFFLIRYLRGQRIILGMPPKRPTISRNQCAPVSAGRRTSPLRVPFARAILPGCRFPAGASFHAFVQENRVRLACPFRHRPCDRRSRRRLVADRTGFAAGEHSHQVSRTDSLEPAPRRVVDQQARGRRWLPASPRSLGNHRRGSHSRARRSADSPTLRPRPRRARNAALARTNAPAPCGC